MYDVVASFVSGDVSVVILGVVVSGIGTHR